MQTIRLREPVSALTHWLGAAFALVGLIWLAHQTYTQMPRLIVSLVYGTTIFIGFTVSSVMHSYIGDRKILKWLIRFDHAAIFIMFAGTYTPIVYTYLGGVWRWIVLAIIWIAALAGVIYKLLTWKRDTLWQTASYGIMATVTLLFLGDVLPRLPFTGLMLFVAGSLSLVAGTLVFVTRRPNLNEWWGFHEIWHLFVLLSTALYFGGVVIVLLN